MGGAGYSGPVLKRSQLLLDDIHNPISPPRVPYEPKWAWPEEGVRQSSPNHEAGAWNNEMVRSALHGTPEQFEKAKDVLLNAYYPRELGYGEKGVGIGANELICPDNHTHQHLNGVAMGRIAAVISQDENLLFRSAQLMQDWVSMLMVVATPGPDYFVGSAGFRSPHKPYWYYATAFLRQIMLQPGPLPEFERKPERWMDLAAAPIRALRWLQQPILCPKCGLTLMSPSCSPCHEFLYKSSIHERVGVANLSPKNMDFLPKLKTTVQVYRKEGHSHLVIIPRPSFEVKDVCDWVEVPHNLPTLKKTMEHMRYGLNWETPPPQPQPGSKLYEFPVTWEGKGNPNKISISLKTPIKRKEVRRVKRETR